jgi:hypothetical protein
MNKSYRIRIDKVLYELPLDLFYACLKFSSLLVEALYLTFYLLFNPSSTFLELCRGSGYLKSSR